VSHPRFPRGMGADVRRAIADEVDITMAGFPSKRPLEQAITAYAEQLEKFEPEDIRDGFREARKQSFDYAPSPSRVLACVATARRGRVESEEGHQPIEYPAPIAPEQIPDWRQFLRGMLPEVETK
jgi:hypothetical protein